MIADELRMNEMLQRESFACFCRAMFPVLAPGRVLDWNWHHYALCAALERVERGECQRLLIEAPPRSLKSVIVSVMFPAWALGRKPEARIIGASYSLSLGIKGHNDCRTVMRSAPYRILFPHVVTAEKDTETELVTAQRGGRYVTSPDGTLTGRGGDIILLDDILSAKDAHSTTKRDATNDWLRTTALSRLDDKRSGAIVVCCQRLHVGDLPGELRTAGGWEILSLPAIASVDQTIDLGDYGSHRFKAGDVLHRTREPHKVLDEIRQGMGSTNFSAQYLQQPVPTDGEIVKWSWFGRYAELPATYDGYFVLSWDIATSTGANADYSVGTIWFVLGNTYYLVDLDRSRSGFPDLLRRVRALANKWQVRSILIEDAGPGIGFIQQYNAIGGVGQARAIGCRPQGDKLTRFVDTTPMIEAGHVLLPNHAPWLEEFRRELAEFPNGRHDDQVDSVSQFLKWQRTRSTPGVRLMTSGGGDEGLIPIVDL